MSFVIGITISLEQTYSIKLPMQILFPAYISVLKQELHRTFLDYYIIWAGGQSCLVFLWVGCGSWRRL